jgi:hypothetical protein|uniref:Uncharacterized protein n=1 Tax=Fagus sylvatica TaxID=28930 RepID=A0A2N9HMZ3_FAGSY
MVKRGGRGKGRGRPPKSTLLEKSNESSLPLSAQVTSWADDALMVSMRWFSLRLRAVMLGGG